MLVSVAYTNDRATYMDYCSTPLLTVWGELYVNTYSKIDNILGLEGKRIAVMKSDINGEQLKVLTKKLSINCTFIDKADFQNVFESIVSNEVDAGVVNNTFGAAKSKEYNIHSSGIVFNPFDIYLTVHKNKNSELLKLFENYLTTWKHDEHSVYNISRLKWSHGKVGAIQIIPVWLKNALISIIGLTIILLVFVVLLRSRVKKATTKVKDSENAYRYIVETTIDLITVVDNEGKLVFANHASLNFFGLHPDECLGRFAFDFTHPDDAEITQNAFAEWIHSEDSMFYFENRSQNVKGIVLDVAWNINIERKEGEVVKITSIGRDITEQKKVQKELLIAKEKAEESERKLIEAQKLSHVGNWDYFVDTDTVTWSKELFNIFERSYDLPAPGYSAQQSFYTQESFTKLDKSVQDCIQHGISYDLELDIITARGTVKQIISKGKAKKDENNKIIGSYGTAQDITKQKSIEFELEKAKEKAEESDRLKSAFLANMSHEIRTPMNSILGFSNRLKKTDLSQESRDTFISYIQNNGEILMKLVNDIIDISKIESTQFSVKKEIVLVNDIMNELLVYYRDLKIKDKIFEFVLQVPPGTENLKILTDNVRLRQLMNNLIDNAVNYGNNKVEFGYTLNEKNSIQFFVKDNGPGIHKEKFDIIFERFFQLDTVKNIGGKKGVGLGLSICKLIVENFNGEIWLESQIGTGTTFYFTIPLFEKN
jgi:PAS domain S-box-containing protein